MNVWKIFRLSYFHLIHHSNLYSAYPKEYFDNYLYSPSFAVLFAPFSVIPGYVAYFLWNNLSMLSIPFLLFKLKGISYDKKCLLSYIVLIEMATCLQGTQTNVMIAAFLLMAFLSFENKNYWAAAFIIAGGFYIKIFPIIAASLFLLYPQKLFFSLKLLVALIVVGILPLLFISPHELYWQYQNWISMLVTDQTDNVGKISLTGFVQTCFNISDKEKLLVQSLGVFIFCLMYAKLKCFRDYYYRLHFFCALLIWMVIFNHAAEIYSYSIAIIGAGIWYVIQPRRTSLDILFGLFIVFTSILTIDPTPHVILDFIYDYSLKSLPYTLLFLVIVYQMISWKNKVIVPGEHDLFARKPHQELLNMDHE